MVVSDSNKAVSVDDVEFVLFHKAFDCAYIVTGWQCTESRCGCLLFSSQFVFRQV